jgi:ankyrin repeat protein
LGELKIVQLLLDRGATRHPDAQGNTPRSLAEKRGHKEIVALLSE